MRVSNHEPTFRSAKRWGTPMQARCTSGVNKICGNSSHFGVILPANAMAQSLNAALLSKDAQFASVIRAVLSSHEIDLVELDDVLRFIDLISQEPFDLVVLDCDGLVATKQVVGTLRQNGANREAVLIVAAPQGDPAAITAVGANGI